MAVAQSVVPVFHGVMDAHRPGEPMCDPAAGEDGTACRLLYHFWGVDFMSTNDYHCTLLEINAWPNLYHLRPAEVSLHEDMDRGMLEMLGYEVPAGPQRWKQLCAPTIRCDHVPNYPLFEAADPA